MQPTTGETFHLDTWNRDSIAAALKSVEEHKEALRQVDEAEIERLQKMSRQQRRAELRKRPKIEAEELKKMLAEAQKSRSEG